MTEPSQTFRGQTVTLGELLQITHIDLISSPMLKWLRRNHSPRSPSGDSPIIPVTYTEVVAIFGERTAYEVFKKIKMGKFLTQYVGCPRPPTQPGMEQSR